MSLQRTCYLCGKPVSIRRHMSLFCSERCEQRHRVLTQEPPRGPAEPPTLPEGALPPRLPPLRSRQSAPRR